MTEKHTHRLKRHVYPKTKTAVYFCTLPDCHYKIECALALGKNSICNICGNEFILNEYAIKLLRPHCELCGKIRVRTSDGKRHFVRRDSLPVMAALSEDIVALRSKLADATDTSEDEDI